MLKFNSILNECQLDPKLVQLVRHQARGPKGATPYSLLREEPARFEFFQSVQGRKVFRREFIASFVATPIGETLFVDLYRVSKPNSDGDHLPH
jgi:hypothetical protein